MKFLKYFFIAALFLSLTASQNSYAQERSNEIKVGYRGLGELDANAFKLNSESTIKLEGSGGLYDRMGNDIIFYGWILDAKTREVVWSLLKEDNDKFFRYRNPGKFSFDTEVKLPAGEYEVYYASGVNNDRNKFDIDFNFGELAELIFTSESNREYRDQRRFSRFSMTLTSLNGELQIIDLHKNIDAFADENLISIVRVGDDEFVRKGFTVKSEVELNILGLGEHGDRDNYDYAWIVDAKTYDKIWPTRSTRYKKAGGGRKNRMVDEKITLSKGDYLLYYISDGSHSYDHWNVMPPYDPQLWGVSVWTSDKDKNKVSLNDKIDHFALQLTKARDNDYLSQAFRVNKDLKVRVFSLGEGSGREMADYGWIINTDTHEKVWEFTKGFSEHAGGASKNRMINEELELEKGNYMAYYVTDGSHSYWDWNATAPMFPEMWGLSILVSENARHFELLDKEATSEKNILAEILRVRDRAYERKNFRLEKDSKVRIYAIGEGDSGDMFDFGWIEDNETGKVVWEMTSRNTDFAGGARKNKLFDGIVYLPEGSYTVYYESDGSHSYRDWNASAPHDQEHYGISVYLVDLD